MESTRSPLPLTVLVDPLALEGRGRGGFLMSAEGISAADVNAMARWGRGLVTAIISPERAYRLNLAPMTPGNLGPSSLGYIASVEAKACTETGISAAERALTLGTLARKDACADDFHTPGHIVPMIAPERPDGRSPLQTVAFAYAAHLGHDRCVAWCDILDEEGEVADSSYCIALAERLGLQILVRRAGFAVDLNRLGRSRLEPELPVRAGGMNIAQFA